MAINVYETLDFPTQMKFLDETLLCLTVNPHLSKPQLYDSSDHPNNI